MLSFYLLVAALLYWINSVYVHLITAVINDVKMWMSSYYLVLKILKMQSWNWGKLKAVNEELLTLH